MKDQYLLDSDILCSTETQLQIDEDTSVIESRFQEHFKIHFNSNENKYRCIAFCYSNRVSVLDHNAISIIVITKPQFQVYFTNARTIDILLGDFNIDAFDGDAHTRLDKVLSSYRVMVKEPTHLDGEDYWIMFTYLNNFPE